MALVVNDRVKETSTTTGTGTFTLDGAVTGFETFSSAIGNSNTTYYAIEIPNSTEFEVGLGTVSAGQLARTTVISSSNSDALVNFSAGTKNVFCTLPASKAVIEDASNNVTLPADLTVGTDTFDVDSTNEKVNIGTTLGSYTGLNVFKKSGPGNIYVHLNGNPGTIIGTSLLSEGTSGDFIINTRDNADIRIYTNNTLRSEFKNNGNFYVDTDTLYVDAVNDRIGIGTSSPSTLLHLSSADPQITITDTDGSGSQVIKADVNDLVLDSPGNIILDAFNNSLIFKDNGQQIGTFANVSGDFGMQSSIADKDIIFRGNDNGVLLTALTLDMSEAGAATFNDKVILGANKSIEFGDAGETISGDGTDLTIASSRHIKFDATNDITLDSGAGGLKFDDDGVTIGLLFNASGDLTFKVVQQDKDLNIKGNDGGSEITALSLDMSEAGTATFNDKVILGANKVIEFGDAGETISGDGTDMTVSSSGILNLNSSAATGVAVRLASSAGGVIVDAASLIVLDADSADNGIQYKDGTTEMLRIHNSSSDVILHTKVQDKDLIFKGNDGGSDITALTLDMSEAGAATFNSSVTVGANLDVSSGTIKLDGNYPTGTNNVAMGDTALDSIGTGGAGHNVAIGHAALTADNTGTGNVGIGAFALTSTVTGNYSTAIGQEALKVNTASWNNAIGFQSMLTSVGGEKNIAMGFWSLKNLGSNDKNVAIGHEAGINLTGGDNNIIIGHNAQAASATTSNQITLGDANITSLRIPGLQSGASSGDILTYDGTDIGLSTPTFISNVVEDTTPQLGGDLDLNSNNITGTGNINNVGTITTDGLTVDGNVSVDSGTIKLDGNYPTGTNNVAMGDTALDSVTTGASNTMIGHQAGTDLLGGGNNTGIGNRALANITSASSNTAVGSDALLFATTGGGNTALGKSTMQTERTGGSNVAVGQGALITQNGGNLNTAIGYDSGNTITTGSNLTLLGYSAQASSATATNEITLGNSNVTSLRIPGLQSGASSGDVLTYDGTDITLSAPTGVSAGFVIAMSIAL